MTLIGTDTIRRRYRPPTKQSVRALKDRVGTVGTDFGCRVQAKARARRAWLKKGLHMVNTVRIEARQFRADCRFVAAWWRSIKAPADPKSVAFDRLFVVTLSDPVKPKKRLWA